MRTLNPAGSPYEAHAANQMMMGSGMIQQQDGSGEGSYQHFRQQRIKQREMSVNHISMPGQNAAMDDL